MTAPEDRGPRRLVLLRHAKAEHHARVSDEQRTLTPAGRRQAGEVGSLLVETNLQPDVVLCSSAVRTRQTFERLAPALDVRPDVEYLEDLYRADESDVLDAVADVRPDARTVLVVGHEPIMSGVASLLAGPESETSAVARVRVGVPTAAFCVLELADSWTDLRPGSAVLSGVVVPAHHD